MMNEKIILDAAHLKLTIRRLAVTLIEQHKNFNDTVIIGIQPRGIPFQLRLLQQLQAEGIPKLQSGVLDVSFYRDDVRQEANIKSYNTDISFSIQDKNVILVDDVLYTGRTIRSAMDALLDFGRPKKTELCVLVDRKFSRHVPIQADYSGIAIDSIVSQKVKVKWKETEGTDEIILLNTK